jgi:uncharacterized membrane protein
VEYEQVKQRAGRRIISVKRLLISVAAGGVAGAAAIAAGIVELALLVGWIAAAAVALVWVWRISWPRDAKGTKQLAEEEGRSRSTDTAVVLAAVASLGAVVSALFNSGGSDNSLAGASVALSIVTVSPPPTATSPTWPLPSAWPTPCPTPNRPVTVIRKTALGHALLSYLFGTGVIATAINLVTNLRQS